MFAPCPTVLGARPSGRDRTLAPGGSLDHITDGDLFYINETIEADCDGYSLLYLFHPQAEDPEFIRIYSDQDPLDSFLPDLQTLATQFPAIKIQCVNLQRYPSVLRVLRKITQPCRVNIVPCLFLCLNGKPLLMWDEFTELTVDAIALWLTVHVPSKDRKVKF